MNSAKIVENDHESNHENNHEKEKKKFPTLSRGFFKGAITSRNIKGATLFATKPHIMFLLFCLLVCWLMSSQAYTTLPKNVALNSHFARNCYIDPSQDHMSLFKDTAVNFHFTRKCNFQCAFCFHTKKTSFMLKLEDQLQVILKLRLAGIEKINFAGGEPFLYPEQLGEMVKYSKNIGFKSVSIITNGSKLKREWFERYGNYLDILGVSCDSIHADTNIAIGRGTLREDDDQVLNVRNGAKFSADYGIKFKVNTVVCSLNKEENMFSFINELPIIIRWKIFQVLPLIGENTGTGSLRDVTSLLVSDYDFAEYVTRNVIGLSRPNIMKDESNKAMQGSYLMVDEYGRFLDSSSGGKIPTKSILDIGVTAAIEELISGSGGGFDKDMYYDRGGYYPDQWSRNS